MKKIITSFIFITFLSVFSVSFAVESNKLTNPLKVESVQGVIYLAVDIAMYIGVAFSILALIYVGFQFVMAQGNTDKLKEAKMWLLYIIVGLAILISARVIVEILKNTLSSAGVVDSSVFNRN
jgi:nitric oxide reductase large subunit